MHLFKALSELAIAADGMIPKSKMPEEAKAVVLNKNQEMLALDVLEGPPPR
jgi:hypothetical protein